MPRRSILHDAQAPRCQIGAGPFPWKEVTNV